MKLLSNAQHEALGKEIADKSEHIKDLLRDNEDTRKHFEAKVQRLQEDHDRKILVMGEDFEIKEKKVTAALEDKLNKNRINLEKEADKKHNAFVSEKNEEYAKKVESMMADNYAKLKEALGKLHEEGNAQTKYAERISRDVIAAVGLKMAPLSPQLIAPGNNDGVHL